MQVTLLKNSDVSFYKAIKEALGWAESVYIGSAYGSYGAFELLRNSFEIFLRRNGRVRALFDIEEFITEKRLIEELATTPGDSECKVFIKPEALGRGVPSHYHPKFYLFHDTRSYRVIIGSSNFTLGGLKNNIECNLSLSGKLDARFEEFVKFFDDLWTADFSFNVLNHSQLLDAYEKVFLTSVRQNAVKSKKLQKLRKEIEDKAFNIIQAKKDVFNPEFAYLLGLIIANSKIDFKRKKLVIELQRGLANRGAKFEGYYYNPDISDYKISQFDAHRKDVQRISENLTTFFK